MDDPNITMEEYIRLQEEKALSHGETFNWKTATYGKREYYADEDDSFTNFKTEFPAIVFDDITSNTALSCESTYDGDVVDYKTWPGISLETAMISTMDLDGRTCSTDKFLGLNQIA
ncbi:hypothetical protein Tco_0242622 [Tanacetum coccineum]